MANGFVLTKTLRVEWPVKVRVPLDGGRVTEQTFTAVFQVQRDSDVKKLEFATLDVGLLQEALVGAKGIKTPEGEDVEWDEEVKETLIELPHTRLALVAAYNEASAGRRAKN
ncbi:hypothetical protein [Azospirillum sp. A39]|uniref:hypothetical protein n=1 Tax=Azospirillum sp. A39 TaxID=3462279 RepID=UPI00404537F9